MLLNILGGSLYSTPTAIVLTSFLTAAGSTIAHSLSRISLVWMLSRLCRKRVKQIKQFYNAYSSTRSFAENTRFVASMRMLPVMDVGDELRLYLFAVRLEWSNDRFLNDIFLNAFLNVTYIEISVLSTLLSSTPTFVCPVGLSIWPYRWSRISRFIHFLSELSSELFHTG